MSKSQYYYMMVNKCALPCPHMALSLTGAVLLIIVFGLLPKEITPKMEIIISFALCSIPLSISYIMAGSQETYCGKDKGWMVQKDALCGINGTLVQFGALGIIFWWAYMCYDFFMSIRNVKKPWPFMYHRILIWGALVLLCAIPLAGNQMLTNPKTIGCWLHRSFYWQLVCFHIPSWICLIFIIYSTVYSVFKVYSMYKIVESKSMLYYNVKHVIIMITVLFNFVFVVSFNFVSIAKNNVYNNTLQSWVRCLAINGEENCELDLPDFILRILVTIATTDGGLLGFLAYGLEYNNIKMLKSSRFYGYLTSSISSGSSTTGSSSGSGSGSDSNKGILNNNGNELNGGRERLPSIKMHNIDNNNFGVPNNESKDH
ncbi:hypothetical protein SAMD00019534_078640 [Acytostelium subglobosum LB1]|uniref:hypothetical protein n=1 Tax=Acytostelium subglobosum LB1 TaxID=1410327 RepID=UPI000644FDE6|nr:hypothetical protein SAMD00019534_078640 [Acytostelium subglobosum LB1]GAM24689.1 hypothetical protein SAMD00019534_078640 [Acytostelium subglobosum LB1]|eukprot:XP_012752358.1 hypothetical protein SAMD00019534_078640 [Acytostelium subglobosum LB1]